MNSVRMMILFVVFTLALPLSATASPEAATPEVAGKPASVKYPFVAEVVASDVYIRSGKGTAYYHCGKAQKGDTLTVFEEVFGWAKILPPEGCYSWIDKEGVDIEGENSMIGVLNGTYRVWAGSDYIQPSRSASMQTKLNAGEIVELMPDQPETGDHYKIKSPTGAYLWISSKFLKYAGPVNRPKPILPAPPTPTVGKLPVPDKTEMPASNETAIPKFENLDEGEIAASVQSQPSDPVKPPQPAMDIKTPTPGTTEAKLLETCYALSAAIDQQLQKPLVQQDYGDVRSKLEAIKANAEGGQASTYAQILLERVERYELAISVINTLKEQDKALEQKKQQIEKARQDDLENLPKDTRYIFSGLLKPSHVYTQKTGQQRYLLLDPSGRILCYVIADSEATAAKLKSMIGLKVGIRGDVSNDKNSLKTLISATTVDLLQ